MRPLTLDEFVGQSHLISNGKVLRNMIERDQVCSMVLWGPPGVGKTTLAKIIAHETQAQFIPFSAVTSGIAEIKKVMSQAEQVSALGKRTILFVDEIHRFNKAQQDAFLPYVESGAIILIGATTENPSFEVNSALLSRLKVFVLEALTSQDIETLIRRALSSEQGFGSMNIEMGDELILGLAEFAAGDARMALSLLEILVLNAKQDGDKIIITSEILEQCTSRRSFLYDKRGEEHYNLISALHKSMRNSDADAAVYWLARMLESGEDPIYIARRVTRFAAEDVGLADPEALKLSVAAFQACHLIGMPECSVHLTEAVIYNALAPKSNAMERAYMSAAEDARATIDEPVPMQIRNAPTSLMKDLGYGDGYIYAHDTEDKIAMMDCLPDSLSGKQYYDPRDIEVESRFLNRYNEIQDWRKKHKK